MSSDRDRPGIRSTATDLELLRAFEPIVRYTGGEHFFPMDVERYVATCSLWVHREDGDQEIVHEGGLTVDMLLEPRELGFESVLYLRFIGPLGLQESAKALTDARKIVRHEESKFRAGVGRLARGGLLPRLADAIFASTLLLRGRVPGATAAAAIRKYSALHREDERYVYHGRVVRQGGWTVLQYWYFFAYNNWRSGFHGVNDHESDWEMVSVYLYEQDGQLVPEWAAYASHDFHGADLRRRWDDAEELELEGTHPIVYQAAGSHASYFLAGEYQAEVPLPVPDRVEDAVEVLRDFWRRTLGQASAGGDPLRIPFVDFARGDGVSVGVGQSREWTPVLVDDSTPWAYEFRGLWGLYAQDPIAGENAPAGPMYNRDGSPRSSWFDPLGFAELDRVPPPPVELELLAEQVGSLAQRQDRLDDLVPQRTEQLQRLGIHLQSLEGSPHLLARHESLGESVRELSGEVKALRRERSENVAVLDGLRRRLARLRAGERDDPHAHIRKAARPVALERLRFERAAEFWAAASISALLVGLFLLIVFEPDNVWAGVIVLLIAFVLGESILRASFVRTVNRVAVVLALVAAGILAVHFWKIALLVVLIGLASLLILQRLRELRA